MVIVTEMLNIVTNIALEMFIVTGMGNSVTVKSLGVCCREEIRLLAIRCPRLGALQVVLEGVSVDNSTKLLNRPRSYGLESILERVSVEDELQEHQSGALTRSFNRELQSGTSIRNLNQELQPGTE